MTTQDDNSKDDNMGHGIQKLIKIDYFWLHCPTNIQNQFFDIFKISIFKISKKENEE